MEFVWAVLAAIALVFAMHFGVKAFDCHQQGGELIQTLWPVGYACVRN